MRNKNTISGKIKTLPRNIKSNVSFYLKDTILEFKYYSSFGQYFDALFILQNHQCRFARFFLKIHGYKFNKNAHYELTNEIIFRIL